MKRPFIVALCLLAGCVIWLSRGDAVPPLVQQGKERIFPTPADARKSPAEKLAYVVATYAGTGIKKPDYLETLPPRGVIDNRQPQTALCSDINRFKDVCGIMRRRNKIYIVTTHFLQLEHHLG